MPLRATVTSKGQITIPQEVRRRLGLKQGDQIVFVTENGATVIKPLREDNPFEQYAGALGGLETKDDVNTWLSGLRDDEYGDEDDKDTV